jgi:meckelin
MKIECNVPPAELLGQSDVTFFDLYFYYEEGSTAASSARLADIDSGLLYPVPVRLHNMRIDGTKNNANRDQQGRPIIFDDQLTRRFFSVDAASGVLAYGDMPRVVRYLKSATLTATLRTADTESGLFDTNRILPPVLDIEYGEVVIPLTAASPLAAATSLAESNILLASTFEAVYTMEMETSYAIINYFFTIALVLWLLVTLGKAVFYFRRNQSATVDGYVMMRVLAQAADTFSSTFFFLLLIICVWWTVTYKGQTELYMLMPAETPPAIYLGIMPFQVFIGICFGAKLIHMIDLLYVQTQHDLYFIDWEQPRSLKTGGDVEDEATTATREDTGGGSTMPVSVWRTIFVANEWVKLQDVRAVSMEVNLIALLFLLRGVGIEHFAALVPHGQGQVGVPYHTLLRFGISSSLLIAISLTQWLLRWAVWERFVKDRIWQFVDLLAVTNVSCLLLEERHFGFYLHGRSVHDHADADMMQLNANLKREEEGLEMLRGFRQESTVQTFEVYLSPKVRQRYDEAFVGSGDVASRNRARRPEGAGATANPRRRGFRAAPDEGVERHKKLNRFLMTYLGTPTGGSDAGSGAGGRPEVRKKKYWEQLLGVPPEMQFAADRSLFLEDTSGRFKRLLLAGREFDMVLLGVLTYALLDMASANTFIAIFGTYAMDVGVRKLRAELATRNIAAKTLLDDRFLL